MIRTLIAFVGCLALASAAPAAPRTGSVSGVVQIQAGKQHGPVMVWVVGFSGQPDRRAARLVLQKEGYQPELLAVTVGQELEVLNLEARIHQPFSRSPGVPTALKTQVSLKKGQRLVAKMAKEGAVDLYDSLHPTEAATVLVLPNRAFAAADAHGRYRIDNLPPGDYAVYAYQRRMSQPQHRKLHVVAGKVATVDWALPAP